jgi:hypothetical protein
MHAGQVREEGYVGRLFFSAENEGCFGAKIGKFSDGHRCEFLALFQDPIFLQKVLVEYTKQKVIFIRIVRYKTHPLPVRNFNYPIW